MANQDDLARLFAGERDLSGCDFTDADFADRDLSDRDFSFAKLVKVTAHGTNFSGSRFGGATIVQLLADRANFSSAAMTSIGLNRCSFVGANFHRAVLSSSALLDVDFSRANLTGANFRSAHLSGATKFDDAITDADTDFDGTAGPRAVSRSPVFQNYTYDGGYLRRNSVVLAQPAHERVATGGVSGVGRVAGEATQVSAASDAILGNVTLKATAEVIPAIAVQTSALRIANDPRLFQELAEYAARSIRRELEALDAKIPNDAAALEGYKTVRATLVGLQIGFEDLASTVRASIDLPDPVHRATFLEKAARAAFSMCQGFVAFLDENGEKAGRVIAELGLAGTIAGTLSYFVGVPPMISFPVTVAALHGKNVWDAIVLFAPTGKGKEK
jgi:uncharacterized protein YjbI with pentapeptide repeats